MANLSGKPRPLEKHEKDFIHSNHSSMPAGEMSFQLKRSVNTVYSYMVKHHLKAFAAPGAKRKPMDKRPVPEGCFNVDDMKEGWLV